MAGLRNKTPPTQIKIHGQRKSGSAMAVLRKSLCEALVALFTLTLAGEQIRILINVPSAHLQVHLPASSLPPLFPSPPLPSPPSFPLSPSPSALSLDHPACFVQCCFTSTETVLTVRDREPRTSTSTFTQLLTSGLPCSSSMLHYVHRDYKN